MKFSVIIYVWLVFFLLLCLVNSAAILEFRLSGETVTFAFLLPFVHCAGAVVISLVYHVLYFAVKGALPSVQEGVCGCDVDAKLEVEDSRDSKAPLILRLQVLCALGYVGLVMALSLLGMVWPRPIWLIAGFVAAGIIVPLMLYWLCFGLQLIFKGKNRATEFMRRDMSRMAKDRSARHTIGLASFFRVRGATRNGQDGPKNIYSAWLLMTGWSFVIVLVVWLFNMLLVAYNIFWKDGSAG